MAKGTQATSFRLFLELRPFTSKMVPACPQQGAQTHLTQQTNPRDSTANSARLSLVDSNLKPHIFYESHLVDLLVSCYAYAM